MPSEYQLSYDRLIEERGPVNIFLAIANAPNLIDSFLSFTADMKKKAEVEPKLRELAILMVGEASGAQYEVDHHSHIALAAGVRPAQLSGLGDFETSPEFDETERAVLRYARHVTVDTHVPDGTWRALLDVLGLRKAMDIVFATAWYNAVARMLIPLQIQTEDWVEPIAHA